MYIELLGLKFYCVCFRTLGLCSKNTAWASPPNGFTCTFNAIILNVLIVFST